MMLLMMVDMMVMIYADRMTMMMNDDRMMMILQASTRRMIADMLMAMGSSSWAAPLAFLPSATSASTAQLGASPTYAAAKEELNNFNRNDASSLGLRLKGY